MPTNPSKYKRKDRCSEIVIQIHACLTEKYSCSSEDQEWELINTEADRFMQRDVGRRLRKLTKSLSTGKKKNKLDLLSVVTIDEEAPLFDCIFTAGQHGDSCGISQSVRENSVDFYIPMSMLKGFFDTL